MLKRFIFFVLLSQGYFSFSQFIVDGQFVQRTEFRNGYGKLMGKNDAPAFFVGQRARLQTGYDLKKVKLYVSIQDVRIWGGTPQVKLSDGLLSVHEAWAETILDSTWSLKLGRQELNYDNARFLGNLDWALQARAHDFALIKYEKNKLKLHIGAGYNQDAEKLSGTIFTISNQYKTAQMLHFENSIRKFDFAFLFWNNGRQFIKTDSLNRVIDSNVRFLQTVGIPMLRYQMGNTIVSGFYYHQFGRDIADKQVNAFDASIQLSHLVEFNKERKLRLTAGGEIISGTDINNNDSNFSFSPLYGTNHAHNGYMDMFYVGGRHEGSVGLVDLYIRLRCDINTKLFLSLNTHAFNSYAHIYDIDQQRMNNYLGSELDFTFGYMFNDVISFQVGYSQFFKSTTLETIQKTNYPNSVQNWSYCMIIYRPKMKNRFIGLIH